MHVDPMIAVVDVEKSSAWYQKLLGCRSGHGGPHFELLAHGSHEEIELRACALHATERLVEQLAVAGLETSAGQLDQWLWRRGARAEYKAHPRHRTRCTFY